MVVFVWVTLNLKVKISNKNPKWKLGRSETTKLTLLDRSQRNRVCEYYWVDRDTKHLGHKHRYFDQWNEYLLPKHQPSRHIRHCKLALLCSVIFLSSGWYYKYLLCLKCRWIRAPLQDRSHSMISHNWSHRRGNQFHNSPYKDSSKYSWSQRRVTSFQSMLSRLIHGRVTNLRCEDFNFS